MSLKSISTIASVCLMFVFFMTNTALSQTTAFNYQGRLNELRDYIRGGDNND